MKIRSILLLLLAAILTIVSCRTRNDINYLQDVDKAATRNSSPNGKIIPCNLGIKW